MEWCDCMRGAIDYVEENLKGNISFDKAAQIACCSTYHFQRMFSFMMGVPLSEYIRRRRMTLAAFELQNTSNKIIDIAYDCRQLGKRSARMVLKRVNRLLPGSRY